MLNTLSGLAPDTLSSVVIAIGTVPLAYVLAVQMSKFSPVSNVARGTGWYAKRSVPSTHTVIKYYFAMPFVLALVEGDLLPHTFSYVFGSCCVMFLSFDTFLFMKVITSRKGWSDSEVNSRKQIDKLSSEAMTAIFRKYLDSGDYWFTVTGLLRRGKYSEGTAQAAVHLVRDRRTQSNPNSDRLKELITTFQAIGASACGCGAGGQLNTLGKELLEGLEEVR